MVDFIKIVRKADKFRKKAEGLLARHETSPSRTIDLQKTIRDLAGLNLKQHDLLDEALECVQRGIFRSAHVMAWAAMADYLEEWLIQDKKNNLTSLRPKWDTSSIEAMMEKANEHQVIETLRVCGYFRKTTEQSLLALLRKRNLCAHPTSYEPDLNMTIGYISELKHWFSRLENLR